MSGEGFQGKPTELINKALALSPEDPQALLLAGRRQASDATSRPRSATGSGCCRYLNRGPKRPRPWLQQLHRRSQQAMAGRTTRRQRTGDQRHSFPAGEACFPPQTGRRAVRVRAGRWQQGMPLAVIRTTADKLPLDFRLDDSMALPGGEKLSSATRLTIEARITRSGTAETASGDLFGRQGGIKPGTGGIRLVIDKVVP